MASAHARPRVTRALILLLFLGVVACNEEFAVRPGDDTTRDLGDDLAATPPDAPADSGTPPLSPDAEADAPDAALDLDAPLDGDDEVDMVDPPDPVDPTDPVDPKDPVDPTDPTDPVDPPPMGLPDGPSSDRQTPRFVGSTASSRGYYEYLPPGYGDGTARPLLIFFHGLGENGAGDQANLPKVLNNGPPRLIHRDEWPSSRPFVVLSPQHPGGGCFSAGEIRDFIAHAMTSYDIDPQRVYLTGLSCGAIGLWSYLAAHRGSVAAAAVAIAGDGRGPWNNAGCAMGEVPIWGFHGDNDGTVNVQGTLVPMNGLLACPAPPRQEALLTIYPGVGHDSWTRTYNGSAGHDIYAWMLSKRKANATPVTPPIALAPGRTLRVDLGAPARTTPGAWNNITGAGTGSTARLLDDQGATTTASLERLDAFDGVNEQGAPQNSLGYPSTAASDMLWLGSFDGHQQALARSARVRLSGLTPNASYDLRLFASRTGDDGGAGRLTRYSVGQTTRDLDASDNTSQQASFDNISADAQGHITITIAVSPAGTSRFAYLSLLTLRRR